MKLRLNSLSDGQQELRETLTASDIAVEDPPFAFPIEVTLFIDKEPQEIRITGTVKTMARFECDRCLDWFTQALQGDFQVLVTQAIKPLGTEEGEDEDLITIAPTTSEIDLTSFIYDTLLLSVPMKKLCRPDCQGLCPLCGTNLNHGRCHCPQAVVDERWAALHKLSNPLMEE